MSLFLCDINAILVIFFFLIFQLFVIHPLTHLLTHLLTSYSLSPVSECLSSDMMMGDVSVPSVLVDVITQDIIEVSNRVSK